MLIMSKVVEFCKDNPYWVCHHDYDEKGREYFNIDSKDLGKSVTINFDLIKKIIIESNQLCIALKSGIMVWLGGDTESLSIDTADYNNPLLQ